MSMVGKNGSVVILIFFLLSILSPFIPLASAQPTYIYSFDKKEKAATIKEKKLISSEDIFSINQVELNQDITTFTEYFELTAIKGFRFPSDFTGRGVLYKGSENVYKTEWFIEEPYKIDIPDYGLVNESYFNETTKQIEYQEVWKQTGSHKENHYHYVPFEASKKTLKKDETIKLKLIFYKKADVGEFSILTIPNIMGVEIPEMTWWNNSWNYKIESVLNDVPSGGYQYSLNVSSGNGVNNQTHVYLNGRNSTNFTDVRFVLDDVSELAYWIENNATDPIRVLVNVTGNGVVSLYCDNPSASSTSNGTNTFVIFDDIDSYTNGDLNGQGGWSGHANFDVQGTVYQGASGKAVQNSDKLHTEIYRSVSFTSGILTFYIRGTDTANYRAVSMDDGTAEIFQIILYSDATIRYRDSADLFSALPTPTSYVANTWYKVEIIFDCATDKYVSIKINDVEKGSNIDSKPSASVDRVNIWHGDHSVGTSYFDSFSIRKYVSPEPQWGTWSGEIPKPDYEWSQNYNTQRKLVRTSEGYLHMVYHKWDGSNYRVYYAKSIDNGNTWLETVLTDASVNCTNPSIATNSEDNLKTVYAKEGDGIRGRNYIGISWQPEQTISTDCGEVPSIAIAGNDNSLITWMANLSGTYQIRCYNESVITNITSAGTDQMYPSVAFDSNNYAHVAWQAYNATSWTWNIKYRKYTNAWQDVYNITSGEYYHQKYPCIGINLSNYILITWQTSDNKIKSKNYTTSWQSTEEVCDGGEYAQYNPSLSFYSTNYFYVTWFGMTATYSDRYIIRERHKTTSWSAISDIIYPVGKNSTCPNLIYARYPVFCGNNYPNIPDAGFALIYDEEGTIEFYNSIDLAWRGTDKYTMVIYASNAKTGLPIYNFTVKSSTGETKSTTNGRVAFTCLEIGYYEATVTTNGYYPTQQSIVLDMSKEITIHILPIEPSTPDWPRIHDVQFIVQDIYGEPFVDMEVIATPESTTMLNWSWLSENYGYDADIAEMIRTGSMTGTTDSYGSITFTMIETIKYIIIFRDVAKGINTTRSIYPRNDFYLITIGELPSERIAFWLTTQQNDTANTGNITLHYCDYNDTAKTAFINFTVRYDQNLTIAYTANITSIDGCIENTTIDLNASFTYRVEIYGYHADLGIIYAVQGIAFVIPEKPKMPIFGLNDNQITMFGMFIVIMFALIFGALHAPFGALAVSSLATGIWFFGWLPLISRTAAAIIFPLAIITSVFAILSRKEI